MIQFKHLVLVAALICGIAPIKSEAKHVVVPHMYMFGFAASFNDTIVHFTDVLEVDSVWIDSKSKFLLGRNYYSHQLRSHLSSKMSLPDRICVVQFAKNRKKAEKKLLKMKRLYTRSKDGKLHYDVRYLDDFQFKTINIEEYEQSEEERAENKSKSGRKKRSK